MIIIAGGWVCDPSRSIVGERDILIEGGLIKDCATPGTFKSIQGAAVVDARGKWVVPGLVDVHVHLREPGFEWKETVETGATAAAWGGFTTILCMPNTRPVNDHAEITRFIVERAKSCAGARVLPIGAVSMGLEGKEMALLAEQREAGCVAFSDDGEPIFNAGMMRRALEWSKMLGVPVCCHEEDKNLSCGGCMNESALSLQMGLRGMPKVAEEVMIARDIELARTTGAHVHICHVSSGRSVELVRRAKNDHINVTAEVAPHHLVLTEESVRGYNTNAKMSPPLREQYECAALIQGLADGTIDCVASDHAPHHWDAKEVEFDKAAFGILGVQTTLPIMLELVQKGLVPKERALEAMSSAPARAFKLEGAGSLAAGARADVCVIDPSAKWKFSKETILSKSKNTPFLDHEFTGQAELVLVGGEFRKGAPETGNANKESRNGSSAKGSAGKGEAASQQGGVL
jgi:dihydroorotase